MKTNLLIIILFIFLQVAAFSQVPHGIGGKEVYSGKDVVFHEIDAHTWVGSGHEMSSESLYLVEGTENAVLIDAGTHIADLDKIVASITAKPVMLVATHVHPDHTGSAIDYFPELYINPADTVNIPWMMPNYKGEVIFLEDGEIIDLGDRQLEVLYTPGHTPGSTTFIDKEARYGFSGDAFGSGNLLLLTDFSTLLATCEKTSAVMEQYGIDSFYPGHFFGSNLETKQRVTDMISMSRGIMSGELRGEVNPRGMFGLNLVLEKYGVRINYGEKSIK